MRTVRTICEILAGSAIFLAFIAAGALCVAALEMFTR